MKKTNLLFFIFLALVILLAFIWFYKQSKQSSTVRSIRDKILVATSFYPLYFFSSQIGGVKTDVINITPSGAEPHDYEPTAKDMARIEDSQLLILNGGVESWGEKIKDEIDEKNTSVVIAGTGLLTLNLETNGKDSLDPHVWLDPKLAKQEVNQILQGFKKVDPKNSSYYENNTKKLNDKLDNIYSEYKNTLSNCQKKDIVTSHAAFSYLAKEFNLNQVSITGLSPDEEPSTKRVIEVSDFVKKNNIKYIFFESLVSPKLSETIARETGAETLVLDPLEGITQEEIKKGKNYFTIMKDNLKSLQLAFQCKT